ncbi:MAG: hypothetical protein QG604_147, partial [Candidatus Dependentiae bacterium]|nr:hypothetical protein [Candidatus Dependentiae bacterium]
MKKLLLLLSLLFIGVSVCSAATVYPEIELTLETKGYINGSPSAETLAALITGEQRTKLKEICAANQDRPTDLPRLLKGIGITASTDKHKAARFGALIQAVALLPDDSAPVATATGVVDDSGVESEGEVRTGDGGVIDEGADHVEGTAGLPMDENAAVTVISRIWRGKKGREAANKVRLARIESATTSATSTLEEERESDLPPVTSTGRKPRFERDSSDRSARVSSLDRGVSKAKKRESKRARSLERSDAAGVSLDDFRPKAKTESAPKADNKAVWAEVKSRKRFTELTKDSSTPASDKPKPATPPVPPVTPPGKPLVVPSPTPVVVETPAPIVDENTPPAEGNSWYKPAMASAGLLAGAVALGANDVLIKENRADLAQAWSMVVSPETRALLSPMQKRRLWRVGLSAFLTFGSVAAFAVA